VNSEPDLYPTYWWGPSSRLKLVIDRSIAFFDENMESRIKGKKAITLMTCADESPDTFTPAPDTFRRIFEGLSITYLGGVEAAGCEGPGKVSKKAVESVRKLAQSLT
jgi:multimeric flavodoxin WrbA